MSPFTKPEVQRASLSDRRTSHRGPIQSKARLTVVDDAGVSRTHDILARDQSMGGLSFLLRECLNVGQACTVLFDGVGDKPRAAEIVRSRPISAGRYEMALQFRK